MGNNAVLLNTKNPVLIMNANVFECFPITERKVSTDVFAMLCGLFVLQLAPFQNALSCRNSIIGGSLGTYYSKSLLIPVVHLAPVHPAVHVQELGALQLPPFGQDVDPEQRAKIQVKI